MSDQITKKQLLNNREVESFSESELLEVIQHCEQSIGHADLVRKTIGPVVIHHKCLVKKTVTQDGLFSAVSAIVFTGRKDSVQLVNSFELSDKFQQLVTVDTEKKAQSLLVYLSDATLESVTVDELIKMHIASIEIIRAKASACMSAKQAAK